MSIQLIDEFVQGESLTIQRDDWARLNQQYTQTELIDLISEAIEQRCLPLPLRSFTIDEALSDFRALQAVDTRRLWKAGEPVSKYNYTYPLSDKYIDFHTVGSKSSDYFHQENRYRCASVNAPSPYRIWTTEKLRKNWLKAVWSMNYKEVNSAVFRRAFHLRGYVASQFRPTAAKAIYELLESKHVLDISMGWGDRLAGFCSSSKTASYVGCDPNLGLHVGYREQVCLYGGGKSITTIPQPAEEVDFGPDQFDTVFSSPPFFRNERYSYDKTQSWMRYRTPERWLDGFLFKAIDKAWLSLKPRGFLAINISDVYCGGKIVKLVDHMNEFISGLPGANYLCGVGLRVQARPQRAKIGQVMVEPIFIWQKNRRGSR